MKNKSSAKRIVTEDGHEVFYWITPGTGKSKTPIFLHPGSSLNHTSLEKLEQRLNSEGISTINFDPRGEGLSYFPGKPEDFKLENFSSDISQILESEGISEPSFLAHSFGFMPIVKYASETKNAKDITGVCVSHNFESTAISPIGFHVFDKVFRYLEYPLCLTLRGIDKLKGSPSEYSDQSNLEGKNERDLYFTANNTPERQKRNGLLSGASLTKWDVTENLGKINCPVLLIYGDQDIMVKPKSQNDTAHLLGGRYKVRTLRGPHSLPVLKPQEVFEEMKRYYKF